MKSQARYTQGILYGQDQWLGEYDNLEGLDLQQVVNRDIIPGWCLETKWGGEKYLKRKEKKEQKESPAKFVLVVDQNKSNSVPSKRLKQKKRYTLDSIQYDLVVETKSGKKIGCYPNQTFFNEGGIKMPSFVEKIKSYAKGFEKIELYAQDLTNGKMFTLSSPSLRDFVKNKAVDQWETRKSYRQPKKEKIWFLGGKHKANTKIKVVVPDLVSPQKRVELKKGEKLNQTRSAQPLMLLPVLPLFLAVCFAFFYEKNKMKKQEAKKREETDPSLN